MFLLHVYTLTSIYHLNHLSFESSDLGAPIGLQETDHLTIRILSSFSKSSEAGEVKWGTPGGFFPEFATWTMGYAPRHRLEEEATFTSGDGEALHGLDILGIFGDCPSPMSLAQGHVTEDVVFFFAKSQIVVLVKGFGDEIDTEIPETTGETRKFGFGIVNMVLFLITFPLSWKNHHGDARMGF